MMIRTGGERLTFKKKHKYDAHKRLRKVSKSSIGARCGNTNFV